MAMVEITTVLTLDDETKVKNTSVIKDLEESVDYILETEILMSSPPPIVRPTEPRPL